MKRQVIAMAICGLVICSCVPVAAFANPPGDLGTCMTDSLSGKERKKLARWIFLAMATHPELSGFANATPDDRAKSDKYVGELFTRLLATDCRAEFAAASQQNAAVLEAAFQSVGEAAMMELMSNEDVNRAVLNYAQYVDQKEVNSVLLGQ